VSELTDALIQLLGYKTGLLAVFLVIADSVQTRYLSSRIEDVDDSVGDVRDRVARVEDVHIAADGGDDGRV
jgi:hypothetical protein